MADDLPPITSDALMIAAVAECSASFDGMPRDINVNRLFNEGVFYSERH